MVCETWEGLSVMVCETWEGLSVLVCEAWEGLSKGFPYAVGGASLLTCKEDGSYDASPLECSGRLDLGRVKVG